MRIGRTRSQGTTDTLRRLPMLGACSDRDLRKVDQISTRVCVEPGCVLTREDEAGSEFFVVVEGAVTISRRRRTVNRLGPGGSFGELALLDLGTRLATAVAAEPSVLLVFSRSEFTSLLSIVPRVEHELLRRAAVRIRELDAALDEPQRARSPVMAGAR